MDYSEPNLSKMQIAEKDAEIHWIPARTVANTELKIREFLEKNHYEFFIPTTKKLKKKNGVVTETETPLINSLIFVRATWKDAFLLFRLLQTKMFGIRLRDKKLLTVPGREMDQFIAFTNEYANKVQIMETAYTVGDQMMIKTGPLAGTKGIVTQIDGKNYFVLRLDGLLAAAVRFPKSNLMKVGETGEKTEKRASI